MQQSKQLALVTGATGFIGRRLVGRLLQEGIAVRVLILPHEKIEGLWLQPVQVFVGNMTDRLSVEKAVQGVDLIFHLAALVTDWGTYQEHETVTVGGTKNILESASLSRCRVVLVSSIVVYGDALPRAVCDEDHPWGKALGPYSWAKQEQEKLAWQLCSVREIPLTVVRPANVYGPGSKPWVDDVLAQLKQGLPSLIVTGEQNAGLCYVDNLVEILFLASQAERAIGRAYNASDGSAVTWENYFSDLAQMIGAKPPWGLPLFVARPVAALCEKLWRLAKLKGRPPFTREALNLVGSNLQIPVLRAMDELGYRPIVGYAEGVANIRQHFKSSSLFLGIN